MCFNQRGSGFKELTGMAPKLESLIPFYIIITINIIMTPTNPSLERISTFLTHFDSTGKPTAILVLNH